MTEHPIPARVAALQRDARGLPIPYTVLIDSTGKPDFRVIDPLKWQRAVRCRVCGICGEPLGSRVAFVGGPSSITNRLFTDLPMHRECATYALQVCPFLAAPTFAYAAKLPVGTRANEHVTTSRPDCFGLGITRSYWPAQLGADVVLQAAPFESIEWWAYGEPISGADS